MTTRRAVLVGGSVHGQRLEIPESHFDRFFVPTALGGRVFDQEYRPVRQKPDGEWIYRYQRSTSPRGSV